MRSKKIILLPAVALGLSLTALAAPSFAEDDVYVDFSVLDSLGDNNSPVINSGPLFPVVKPSAAETAVKKVSKPARKKSVSKSAVKKAKPAAKPNKGLKEDIKIPHKEEIKVEVKMPETKNRPVAPKASAGQPLPEDAPFKSVAEPVVKEEVSAAPLAPVEVKTEPLPEKTDEVIMEPVNGHTPLPGAVEPKDGLVAEPEETVVPQSKPETEPVVQTSVSDEPSAPLIEKTALPQGVSSDVVFAADSSELTEENKRQLDDILAGFEDTQKNKIAIFSFNVDDGKDVFRKKRLCLDRAIAVRSYYLAKGYKNYSIKVVNVDAESDLKNVVRVEEFK